MDARALALAALLWTVPVPALAGAWTVVALDATAGTAVVKDGETGENRTVTLEPGRLSTLAVGEEYPYDVPASDVVGDQAAF